MIFIRLIYGLVLGVMFLKELHDEKMARRV